MYTHQYTENQRIQTVTSTMVQIIIHESSLALSNVLHTGQDQSALCSKDTIHTKLDHLQEVFESNAYPPSLVTLNLHTMRNKRSNIVENTEKQPATLATPYMKDLSEKIEKKCKHLNIRTVFSSKRTLRRELVRVKNRVEPIQT